MFALLLFLPSQLLLANVRASKTGKMSRFWAVLNIILQCQGTFLLKNLL